jgi:hypothetical protein
MGLEVFSRAQPQFGRRNTFLHGTIYAPGNPPMPCAVRDLTPAGARLLLPSSSPLPPRFRLLVETTRFESNCALLERSGDTAEVVFV